MPTMPYDQADGPSSLKKRRVGPASPNPPAGPRTPVRLAGPSTSRMPRTQDPPQTPLTPTPSTTIDAQGPNMLQLELTPHAPETMRHHLRSPALFQLLDQAIADANYRVIYPPILGCGRCKAHLELPCVVDTRKFGRPLKCLACEDASAACSFAARHSTTGQVMFERCFEDASARLQKAANDFAVKVIEEEHTRWWYDEEYITYPHAPRTRQPDSALLWSPSAYNSRFQH